MTPERRLIENIRKAHGQSMWVCQGIVKAVDGVTCTCEIGEMTLEGIRLRSSVTDRDRQMLVVPKTGSAVTLGCLRGDMSEMVVLQVDEVESITINGGELGGLIKIQELTDKINALVDKFNSHTHTLATGTVNVAGPMGASANASPISVPAVTSKATKLDKRDYEDEQVKH